MTFQLITVTSDGLYCEAGGFHIDPWRPVERAVITHAHADHARLGNGCYLTCSEGETVLRLRMGPSANVDVVPYGDVIRHGDATIRFYPAGHILGSSQVLVESKGVRGVVSGDYKLEADSTCAAFEPVECDTFITECTFGLPIYRWPSQEVVFEEINSWWHENRQLNRPCVIFAYALGKAQRVLAGIDPSIGPIYCHGAVERVNTAYRDTGVSLPPTSYAGDAKTKHDWNGSLIVAPPSAINSPWSRKFGNAATSFVSGWMRIRGMRRRRSVDRGFVLSDHADWPGLLRAIEATSANRVLATHGQTGPLVRWLNDQGNNAAALKTEFIGEQEQDDADIVLTTDEDNETSNSSNSSEKASS